MLTKTSRRKLQSNESQISSKSVEATEKLANKLKTKKTTFGAILSEVTAKKGSRSETARSNNAEFIQQESLKRAITL